MSALFIRYNIRVFFGVGTNYYQTIMATIIFSTRYRPLLTSNRYEINSYLQSIIHI